MTSSVIGAAGMTEKEPNGEMTLRELWDEAERAGAGAAAAEAWQHVRRAVESKALFSSNEDVDDVSTPSLRYVRVNSLCGFAWLDVTANRLKQNGRFLQYSKLFLNQCDSLGLLKEGDREIIVREEDPKSQAIIRAEKISFFHRKNHNAKRIKELESIVRSREAYNRNRKIALTPGNDDEDEIVREIELLKVDEAICRTIEQMRYTKMEMAMLTIQAEEDDKLAKAGESQKIPFSPDQRRKSPRAFRIEKDGTVQQVDFKTSIDAKVQQRVNIRQQVFKDPNPPTMTIEEAITLEMEAKGIVQGSTSSVQVSDPDETEEVSSDEDDEKLHQKRRWDNWKDDNERGIGNRGYL